jgi:hypothetical protein
VPRLSLLPAWMRPQRCSTSHMRPVETVSSAHIQSASKSGSIRPPVAIVEHDHRRKSTVALLILPGPLDADRDGFPNAAVR